MPDDRSSGYLGSASFVRFNKHDKSGIVTGIPDKKRSKEEQNKKNDDDDDKDKNNDFRASEFVDRSAQLNASLDSLAMLNAASIIKTNLADKRAMEEKSSKEIKK